MAQRPHPPANATIARRALTRSESLARLAAAQVGRLVMSVDCLPTARPVMISVFDTEVFVSIEGGAERDAAQRGDVLALQIDGAEREGFDLWWVEITGSAKLVAWDPEITMLLRGSAISSARTGDSAIMVLPIDHIRGEQTTLEVPGAPL